MLVDKGPAPLRGAGPLSVRRRCISYYYLLSAIPGITRIFEKTGTSDVRVIRRRLYHEGTRCPDKI